MYRRKCIGRCRKQVADYTLMSGLAASALDAYNSAIELLREAKDMLWLAGEHYQYQTHRNLLNSFTVFM